MGHVRIPLDAQQNAHVTLILDLHRQDMAQVDGLKQQADTRRDGRLSVITTALNVPDGTAVSIERSGPDQPCFVIYDQPDVERTLSLVPPAPDLREDDPRNQPALTGEGR